MSDIDNYRGMGDNLGIDQARIVTDRLALDYAESLKTVDKLLNAAATMPPIVQAEHEAIMLGSVIKEIRDLDKRMEAFREAEKQPYLRGGNAVDNFFFAQRDKLASRKPNDRSVKPGAADVLQGRINDWRKQVEAEKRAALERERLEAVRLLREEQERLRKAQEAAAEAERALARARSEATKMERQNEAMAKAEAEARARFEAEMAAEKAEEARLATMVKPADLVRVRGTDASGGGVLLTAAREGYAILTNRQLIDMEALRPFFTDFEIEKALRAWAKTTGHKVQMEGAEVGFRHKGVTR